MTKDKAPGGGGLAQQLDDQKIITKNAQTEQHPFASVCGEVAAYMRSQQRWLLWRDKAPLTPDLRFGSANDRHNFQSFVAASSQLRHLRNGGGNRGIGYALAGDPQLLVFDFDRVRGADGAFTTPLIESMLSSLPEATAHIETSPSGVGLHVYCKISVETKRVIASRVRTCTPFMSKADSEALAKRRDRATADDMSRHTVFVNGGFVTVTGEPLRLARKATHSIDDHVLDWFDYRFGRGAVRTSTVDKREPDLDDDTTYFATVACLDSIDASDRDRWIKVGHILKRMARGGPRGLELWDKWSRTAPDKYPKGREPSTARLYRGFRPNGTLGLGSLVRWAQEGRAKTSADIRGWETIAWAR